MWILKRPSLRNQPNFILFIQNRSYLLPKTLPTQLTFPFKLKKIISILNKWTLISSYPLLLVLYTSLYTKYVINILFKEITECKQVNHLAKKLQECLKMLRICQDWCLSKANRYLEWKETQFYLVNDSNSLVWTKRATSAERILG